MERASDLMRRAQAATGLTDFGEDSFLEGLEILVASVDDEARLNDNGRQAFDLQIVGFLSARLQIEDWYRRHPEIDDEEVVAPLIGLGLPRTGSTALHCLLAEDSAARTIRTWEAFEPCPPPILATQQSDPRIAKAHEVMKYTDLLFPRLRAMLPSSPTAPIECQAFMGYDFKSQTFQANVQIPSYVVWLNHKADLVSTYRYVKRVLKLLQWRCPPTRWRLKNPSHSLFIGALDKVFPDARFWMTHRNVVNVIPSLADLYFEFTRAFSNEVDIVGLGELTSDICELGMRRMIAFRDSGHEHRFFDIHFEPFQANPFPVIEALYAFIGEDLSSEARTRMATWRRNKPRDEDGYERTDMRVFGLNKDALNERFRFYSERFQVTIPVV